MKNSKEHLVGLKDAVANDNMTIEELQRTLSQIILSEELPGVEQFAKKIDNDLELVIYTLNPSEQSSAAIEVIDEVVTYINENHLD